MRSPLAPKIFPHLPPISGVKFATAATGLRYKGRDDLVYFKGCEGAKVAGVFTNNSVVGAPVTWSRAQLAAHAASSTSTQDAPSFLINAGNANVFIGELGREIVEKKVEAVAKTFGGNPGAVYVASTGVIGEPFDPAPIINALPDMKPRMGLEDWERAAHGIMTTDTFAKAATMRVEIDGHYVRINGIAKGSGMIAPDMATMLGFIFTDANISQPVLQMLLNEFTKTSFNAVTVDSDTSTSDMVLLMATGRAAHGAITDISDPRLSDFSAGLQALMDDLATQIVRDGEGATKFITVTVTGATSEEQAKKAAMSIANSPLVKTAIAGEDANWGRIAMALGKAGVTLDISQISIWLGLHKIAEAGARAPEYQESVGSDYMKNQDIDIRVDLGMGAAEFRVWTCDLTHGYIDINADYRS